MGIYLVLGIVHVVIRTTAQGKNDGTTGTEYYAQAHNSLVIVTWFEQALVDLVTALICTMVCDTLYAAKEKLRWCFNLSFWLLGGTSACLLYTSPSPRD